VNGATQFFCPEALEMGPVSRATIEPDSQDVLRRFQQLRILPHVALLLFHTAAIAHRREIWRYRVLSPLAVMARGTSVCWFEFFQAQGNDDDRGSS
jgi:hypothetical protein